MKIATSDDSKIHILMATSDNYIKLTLSSMASILANSEKTDTFHFHIVHYRDDLNESHISAIRDLKKLKQFTLSIDIFDKALLGDLWTSYHSQIFIKFFASSIFATLKKIIWLDGDTIVLKSLFPLWRRDLTNKAFSSVDHGFYSNQITGHTRNSRYMTAGILMMNLDFMRENTIEKKLISSAKEYRVDKCWGTSDGGYEDEHALTYGIPEYMVDHLPYRYNSIPVFFKSSNAPDCVVLHYVGAYKPTSDRYDKNSEFYKIWEDYFKLTSLFPKKAKD